MTTGELVAVLRDMNATLHVRPNGLITLITYLPVVKGVTSSGTTLVGTRKHVVTTRERGDIRAAIEQHRKRLGS